MKKPSSFLLVGTAMFLIAFSDLMAQRPRELPQALKPFLTGYSPLANTAVPESLLWVARDSTSFELARRMDIRHLLGPADNYTSGTVCPGSTNSYGNTITDRLGYSFRINTSGQADSLEVIIVLWCSEILKGKGRGFERGRGWILEKSNSGLRIVRPTADWIS
jgi:hypothetical protein